MNFMGHGCVKVKALIFDNSSMLGIKIAGWFALMLTAGQWVPHRSSSSLIGYSFWPMNEFCFCVGRLRFLCVLIVRFCLVSLSTFCPLTPAYTPPSPKRSNDRRIRYKFRRDSMSILIPNGQKKNYTK